MDTQSDITADHMISNWTDVHISWQLFTVAIQSSGRILAAAEILKKQRISVMEKTS